MDIELQGDQVIITRQESVSKTAFLEQQRAIMRVLQEQVDSAQAEINRIKAIVDQIDPPSQTDV